LSDFVELTLTFLKPVDKIKICRKAVIYEMKIEYQKVFLGY